MPPGRHRPGPVGRLPQPQFLVEWKQAVDVVSAAALAILNGGNRVDISGSTTITSIATTPKGTILILRFLGAPLVTHNGTSLILQSALNFQTSAGSILGVASLGSGNYIEIFRSGGSDIGFLLSYGGDIGSDGQFFAAHGHAQAGSISSPNSESELGVPVDCKLSRMQWMSESATSGTDIDLFINGSSDSIHDLTGSEGSIPLDIDVSQNDAIAVQLDTGSFAKGTMNLYFIPQ